MRIYLTWKFNLKRGLRFTRFRISVEYWARAFTCTNIVLTARAARHEWRLTRGRHRIGILNENLF